MSNGNDIQAALQQMTGQRTVPNVFIKGKHLGGNDDTQAAHRSGHLQELLSQ
jgi:glutaredoxin 3